MKYISWPENYNKLPKIDVYNIDDWEGFEKVIEFLRRNYNVQVVAKYDGPDARRWILECNGVKFELIHDDGYGNYFIAPSKNSEKIVCDIAKDIENRMRSAS
jgi:hypothetical protein